mgnify:CR=1 FL=1
MILLGVGAGMAFNPVLLAAMSDVEPSEAGLASGVVNTAVHDGRRSVSRSCASPARRRAPAAWSSRRGALAALNGGYHLAFLVGALFAAGAGVAVGAAFLRVDAAAAHATRSSSPSRRARLPEPFSRLQGARFAAI